MTKDEVFAQLREAFKLDSTLKKYKSLEPLEGLTEAVKYWDWAKGMQDRTTSDSKWWAYENEKTLAYVLMGIFCWRLLGHDDFPPLPEASQTTEEVLGDPHALLCLWSRCLPSDHVHKWENCHHHGTTNKSPSHPKCKATRQKEWGGFYHQICGVCGEERFDPQPLLDKAHETLEERGVKL